MVTERENEFRRARVPGNFLWRIFQSHLCLVFFVQKGEIEVNRTPEAVH